MIQKTRVYKVAPQQWRVIYYMPHGGLMIADFTEWRYAMFEATEIEKQKALL